MFVLSTNDAALWLQLTASKMCVLGIISEQVSLDKDSHRPCKYVALHGRKILDLMLRAPLPRRLHQTLVVKLRNFISYN